MRFEIIGSLRVIDETGTTAIKARKLEIILTTLLARFDRTVSSHELMTEIWGSEPPRRATETLYVYISQLRKLLHRPARGENPIITVPNGYLLRRGPDELDVDSFQRWAALGRASAQQGRNVAAAQQFGQALALYRGPVLDGLAPGPIVEALAACVEETRLECTETLMEARLALGHHRELISQLYALARENPLRESFHRQLMLALYRAERRADALNAYQSARQILREELGLEPGQTLRDLQVAILQADEQLKPPGPVRPGPAARGRCRPATRGKAAARRLGTVTRSAVVAEPRDCPSPG